MAAACKQGLGDHLTIMLRQQPKEKQVPNSNLARQLNIHKKYDHCVTLTRHVLPWLEVFGLDVFFQLVCFVHVIHVMHLIHLIDSFDSFD